MVPTNTPERIEVITSFVIKARMRATNGGRRERIPPSTGSIAANDHILLMNVGRFEVRLPRECFEKTQITHRNNLVKRLANLVLVF